MKSIGQGDYFSGIKFQNSEDDDTLLKSAVEALPEEVSAKDDLEKRGMNASVRPSVVRPGKKRASRKNDLSKSPDAILDLHGKTKEEALISVQSFVMGGHRQRQRSILIITGKGHHSGEGGPVLNQAVRSWLQRHGHPYIKDFSSASPRYGGTGALWVDLR